MTDRELMQQALKALQAYGAHVPNCDHLLLLTSMPPQRMSCSCGLIAAITALRDRLAQPKQEPVAWMDEFGNVFPLGAQRGPKYLNEPMKPLYTTPPQRTWVGLTDEEVHECLNGLPTQTIDVYARRIEAKLKEKNK